MTPSTYKGRSLTYVNNKATKARGNWKDFDSFVWHGQPLDSEEYCLVYTKNRDSHNVELSNHEVIDKAMQTFDGINYCLSGKSVETDEGDVITESHNHWAVGWVEGFAIRVFQLVDECPHCKAKPDKSDDDEEHLSYGFIYSEGKYICYSCQADIQAETTPAFNTWCEFALSLEDYPLLDETDYSQREFDDTLEQIAFVVPELIENLPSNYLRKIYSWLWENDQLELEVCDGRGACPSESAVAKACETLGFYKPEKDEEV